MTQVVIVDDELRGRETLNALIEKHCPEISVVGIAGSAKEGFEVINNTNPDIVFLDVEMPGGNGFDMLEMFSNVPFEVVFTTAYGHYAIKAIKHSALDYLLKPVEVDELQAVVKQFREKKAASNLDVNISTLLANLKNTNTHKKLVLPDGQGLTVVETEEIVRLESEGSYTVFYLTQGRKYMISKHLKEFENTLSDNAAFVRVHRSHLINMEHVKRYIKGEGGYAVMSDASEVEISRRRKNEFLQLLGNL